SLAFDTLCREGQRRFLESLSAYARQFLGQMERARVESLSGLSPTIAIHQKTIHRNPRSTVGTVTEIYDHYRLLFARLGTPHCVRCGRVIETQTTDRITDRIVAMPEGTRIEILAPIVRGRKGEYRKELAELARNGFLRARIDGEIRRLDEEIILDRYRNHTIEIVIDRIVVRPGERSRIAEGVEQAAALGADGNIVLLAPEGEETISTRFACPTCGIGLPELEPRLFSFNAPQGACPTCKGIGELRTFDPDLIVPDPERSIAEGAIVTMTKDGRVLYNRWGIDDWRQAGEQLGFSIDRPWKDLSEAHRRLLLYGDPETIVEIRWKHQRGTRRVEGHDRRPLPGVIPMLERAYHFSAARHLERYMNLVTCPDCEGSRLRPESLAVTFRGRTIAQLSRLTVQEARAFFAHLEKGAAEEQIGGEIFREIENRLRFLDDVGLGYLTIDRRVGTLSGGESQRIRLAGQIGSGLRGVLYVLDEPSIGLHPRDNARLLATLTTLRDQGNTVVVVEHDEATMRAADFLVDIGPGAGREGGELVAAGTLAAIERASASRTGAFLRGDAAIPVPERRRTGNGKVLRIEGAEHFNLKGIDVEIPLGVFTCVTGVSGSGKSTLIHEILHKALARVLHGAKAIPGKHRRIVGIEAIDKVIEIDQSPIGRTPRSNPATYTGLLDPIRELMAMLPRSRARGYKKGRFSFNVRGGRCEACEGAGVKTIDMQFLAPVEVLCEVCEGTRFNRETLEVTYKGKHIADILAMSVEEAYRFFEAHPKVRRILECLSDIGLGYLTLGQPSTTLSGGEAQRIKLVTELCRPATGRTLYLLDEPSTGLHPADIERLLHALDRLVEAGNSVVVIEHNLDIIKVADHIVDLGPGSGAAGGEVVFAGTPEALVADGRSPLAPFLAEALAPPRRKPSRGRRRRRGKGGRGEAIEIVKASKNNLKEIDVTIPHRTLTVITGVSGSGKSSLAFDTIFAEGQRRYVESLSTYARRFLGRLDRAPVVSVRGLAPAIAIDQKHLAHNPRSTVATTT
ncbi:MAG: excinuclease ABC subunit UvrA, partial [Deltaproteobacteria bacterium]